MTYAVGKLEAALNISHLIFNNIFNEQQSVSQSALALAY